LRVSLFAVLGLPLLLSGCSLTPTALPSADTGRTIRGNVHGGQQPINGARIYLLAAGTSGYASASTSLLISGDGSDSIGNYVLSAADGSFAIGGDYTCTPNTQVYLYALGGDPGAGANSAAGLLAALGNCPAAGNFAATVPFLSVNEVSTVAAAYAMAGFATDATHVSSSGSTLAQTGIANAFANAANLADIPSGSALATTPAGNGAAPQQAINTLANILAACINSTGPGSAPCSSLFADATSDGTPSGTAATDTATAAINIAHNPAANVADLFGIPATTPPFGPALSIQPNDFTVALTFTGGGITNSQSMAIDAQGNIWAADTNNAVLEYNSLGAPLSGPTGFINANLNSPSGIAIDASSNVWVSNGGLGLIPLVQFDGSGNFINAAFASLPDLYDSLAISPTGDILIPSLHNGTGLYDFASDGTYKGLYATPNFVDGLAIQFNGSIWTSNDGANTLSELSSTGTLLSGPGFPSSISNPGPLAIDASGNIWQLNGSAAVGVDDNTGSQLFAASAGSSASHFILDGAGNAWVVTRTTLGMSTIYGLAVLSNSGTPLPGASAYISPAQQLNDLQIDGSGNVWLSSGNNLTELVGAAAPVVTPLINAVTNNTLATRP
jgi:hypothetical protein